MRPNILLASAISALPRVGPIGRMLRLPLKLLPRHAVVPVLMGPLRGTKWIVGSSIHRCWIGTYELEKQEAIRKTVLLNSVFCDVGANVGFYSLLASTLVGNGKVYAFEPLPRNLEYLRRHMVLNRVENVEVLPVAVSDTVGTAFFEQEASPLMGHLAEHGAQRVPTVTLDFLVFNQLIAPPNYIKLDIEGAEVKALLGAARCLQTYHPTLFLATHGAGLHRECCRLLSSWNYHLQPLNSTTLEKATELVATSAPSPQVRPSASSLV